MPAGASTEQPVTIFPSINAVGAKRRPGREASMQMHVGDGGGKGKAGTAIFAGIAGLPGPNPLLYRCIPLTCARSQE